MASVFSILHTYVGGYMSKKSVRVRNSFSRRWAAVISGSLFLVTAHSALAANEDRPNFREFRDANAGIDRSALRQMYKQQFGNGARNNNSAETIQIPSVPVLPEVSTPRDIVRVSGVTRRIENRLEKQGIIKQSIQQIDNNLVNIRGGVNLDLSSANRNITLGAKLFNGISAVEISVGGENKTVQAGSQVSAAEYIAVKQILSGSSQKITLDHSGVAIGGELDLGSITANNDVMRASDLVVPVNVTTYGDFSRRSDFKLLGDLTNAGTVHTYSSHKNGGAIRADDITNQAGALISSDRDLGLFASGNLSNYGTITSKGSLTLSAGNTLTNASEVTAKRDVNLNAPNIVNSGSVTSLRGDITLDGPSTAELNVNGAGGTFTAANAINVRNSEFSGAFNTNVYGGDFYSKDFNMNAGNGIMQTHVGELTGVVTQTGYEAHLSASTDDLTLGEICLTGDPTYKNDSGNINITGNITVPEALSIIASGNIATVNNISITAADGTTGFPITLIAGAEQVLAVGNSTTLPGGATAAGTTLTGFASTTGGSVLIGSNVTISTRSTGATGAGGNVLIAAFEGAAFGSGRVDVGAGTTSINTGGRSAIDANGAVTIIAGLQGGNAVRVGNINTTGGDLSSGQINIITTQPISSNGLSIVYDANGSVPLGNGLVAGPGIGIDANVAFARNVVTNVDVYVDADTITTQTGSSITSNFGTVNLSSINGIIGAGVGSLVSGPTVNLVSQNTDIGASGQRVRVDANNLYVDAPLGSVYVQDIDEVNLLAATVAGDFNILAQGTISNSGAIAGDTVTLRSSGGNISALNTITGVSGVDLRASFNVESTAQITTPFLNVTSDLANIGSVSPLQIDVDVLRVNAANGNARLVDVNSVDIGGGTSNVFGTLEITADFGISNSSNITANVVTLTASNGVFSLGGGTVITGLTAINLNAGQSIQNVDLGASLVAPSINLTSFFANIGTNSANPLTLDAQNITLNAANGNVWYSDPNSVNLGAGGSSALGLFQVTAANSLTSTGTVFATDVELTATAGGFDLDGLVSGSNSIKLTSNNSILNSSISGGLDNGFGGPVANLELTSTGGSIGSLLDSLEIDADNLTFNADGSAYITDANALTVLGNSVAGLNVGITAGGAFDNIGTIDAGNSIFIGADSIDVQNILTAGGNVDLDADTTITTAADIDAGLNVVMVAGTTISTTGDISADNDVTIFGDGTVNVFGPVTAGNDVTIASGTDSVTTYDEITAGNFASIGAEVSVTTLGSVTATAGDVTIASGIGPTSVFGPVNAGSFAFIGSFDGDVQVTSSVTAGDSVIIGAGGAVTTNDEITAGVGDVFITADDDVTLVGAVNAGLGIFVYSGADISATDSLTAQDSIELGAFNDIQTLGSVTSTGASVSMLAGNDVITSGDVSAAADVFIFAENDVNVGNVNGADTVDILAFNDVVASGTISSDGAIFIQADNQVTTTDVTSAGDIFIDGFMGVISNGIVSGDEVFFVSDTASVQLNALVTGLTSVNIASDADILNANISGGIVSPAIHLTSYSGDIGASGDFLNIDTTDLTANASGTGGNVWINVANDVNLADNFTGSSADQHFEIVANNGSITSTGSVSATDVVLTALDGIALGADVTASASAALTADGDITNDAGGVVSAATLDIVSFNNSIGTDANSRFNIDADSLSLSAPDGSAFIHEANSVDITSAIVDGTIDVLAIDDLTTSGPVSGDIVVLEASSGGLTLNGATTATTSATLISADTIDNASLVGSLSAPQVNLVSGFGDIDVTNKDFTNLTANAFGFVNIVDNNGLNFGAGNSLAGSTFTVTAGAGAITSTGVIGAAGEVSLTAQSVDLDGLVSSATQISIDTTASILDANILGGLDSPYIQLTSDNNISISTVDFVNVNVNALGSVLLIDTTGMNIDGGSAGTTFTAIATDLSSTDTITAGTSVSLIANSGSLELDGSVDSPIISLVSANSITNDSITGGLSTAGGAVGQLNLTSINGDIGALGIGGSLAIDAVNLTANASAGSVFISDTAGAVNINGPSSALDVFQIDAVGNLTSTGAGTISADAVNLTTTNGNFDLDGAVTGTSSIALTAVTNSIINGDITGGLTAPTLILSAESIGTSSISRLNISTDNLVATATAGGVFINNTGALNVSGATATGDIYIDATTFLSSTGLISGGGSVVLRSTLGGLDLAGEVRAVNGISLQSNDSILNSSITGGLTGAGGTTPVLNLALFSDSGDIGEILNALTFDTVNLTAVAANGDVYLYDNGTSGGVNLVSNSGALGVFELASEHDITSTGSITADVIYLDAIAGEFGLAGPVIAGTSLSMVSAGSITDAHVDGTLISSPQIDVVSSAGDIDLTTINFTNVTAISSNGYVSLEDANGFNIGGGLSSAATSFSAVALTGNLSSTGTISGDTVDLIATAGSLDLDASVTGATSISLESAGAILDANVSGGLSAPLVELTSTGANIDLTTIDFIGVTANANTSVSLVDTGGSMNFVGSSSAATTFTAVAPIDLTSSASITPSITAANVDLTATTGGFGLDGLVRGTSSITLKSQNSILDLSIAGGLDSGVGVPVAQLNLLSTGGDIGELSNFLNVNAASLRANAPAGSVFIEDSNSVTLGGGSSSALNAFAVLAFDDINVNSDVSAAIVALSATNDIALNANVAGTTAVTLTAGGSLTQTAGLVSGGQLSVDIGAPTATLDTQVASLTTVGNTTDLVINETDSIVLLSQVASALEVNTAGTGDISTGAAISVDELLLSTTDGNIFINNNVTASIAVILDTTSGAGRIEQAGATLITTPNLDVTSGTGGIGVNGNVIRVANGAAGDVTLFAQATDGDVNVDYLGTGTVSLVGSTDNNNFAVRALTGAIETNADIDGEGQLLLVTSNITHSNEFNFDTIVVNTAGSGSNLTISGTGGFFNSENGTSFTTIEGNMTFAGSTTFGGLGDATLTVQDLGGPNNFFTVNGGVSVVGVNRLTVNACDLVLTGTISGNPLVVNCADAGTIANNNGNGDVNLSGNIVFNGGPFAIIASGNINTTGATLIDLTGTTNGGNLTLMAGVTFTPATAGQTQNSDTYTITGFSTQGGNINLSTVNVLTVGNNGNGGSVTAIASAGSVNAGQVNIGDIDTSGTATSGQIRLIGAGGVSTGNIDTTGGITSGNINIAVANPTITGTIFVQDGVVSGGSFAVGTARNGNVSVGNITAPGRDVTILGALGAADTITQNVATTIASNRLILTTGVGIANFTSTDINELNSTGNAAVTVNELNNITLAGVTGAAQDVIVNAGGTITVGGAGVNVDTLALTGNSAGGNAININAATVANAVDLESATGNIALAAALTGVNSVDLVSAGTITQSAGVVSGDALSVSFGSGPVTLSTSVNSLTTLSAGTLTINEANNITLGSQQVDTLTVTSAAGNILTNFNFVVGDLTLTATSGTINVSNDIIVTNTATLTASGGMTTTAGGSVTSNNVVLSSAGTIGVDSLTRFDIVANSMRVAAAQNAFVGNTVAGAVVLGNSVATNTLDLLTIGDLTGAGTASSANTVLATGGKFALTGALTGTTTLTLVADDSIVNADLTGTLTTPSLTLTSVNGSVGVDEATPFNVAANVARISGNALSATGSVFIRSASTTGVTFGTSSAGNDLYLNSAGALTVLGNLTSVNGDLSVLGNGGTLTIGDNTTLTAFSSINIINTTTGKKDKLILGTGSTIATNAKIAGLGDVTIALGATILPPGGNKTPKNTTVNETGGGTVSFSGKRAKGLAPQNTFNAIGADVLVSNSLRNNLIEIRGGVTVTADPPVPVGSPVNITYGRGALHGSNATMPAPATTGDAFAAELISTAPLATTADMQLVSLNNALGTTSSLLGAQGSLGDAASNLASVSQYNLTGNSGRIVDDSFITMTAPNSSNFDVKVCSELELGIASVGNGVANMPHSQCVTMDSGSTLFVAAKDMTVVSPKGKVKLAAGAVALVVADADHLSVYDVNDNHKRSVEVEVGGRSIPLSPGRHVTVTHNKVAQFADINAVETMMHRHVGSHELGNGHKAFTTEFSLPAAIEVLKPLKAMLKSNNADAQKVAQKVYKTSAVVLHMSQGGASFEFHTKPKTVALNW